MHHDSVTSIALGGVSDRSTGINSGGVPSASYQEYDSSSAKSWFNDPFALLDSLGLGYKAAPSSLSYETLRAMAERNVIIAAIIQTRINQVASFCRPQENKYSVGYEILPRDRKKKLNHSDHDYIHKLNMFVHNMGVERNSDRDTLEFFVRKTVRDRLTYDQLCAERVPCRNGKPHSVIAVPADTIRIATPKHKKGTPLTRGEIQNTPKYVQVVDGCIVNEYTRKELIFRVANPRTNIQTYGYGYSELEMLINTVTAHLWAEEWNRKVFSQGSTVKGILNVKGNVAPNQLEAFKRQWIQQVSGVSNAWRTPVMNSEDLQWIPLQPSNSEMGYQAWLEYLIKIACAVFLIDPAEINFDTRAGVGSQPMFMTTNEAQQKVSKDRGLQPLLRFFQTILNEDILWEIDDKYELVFRGLDSRTESEAIELRMKELQSYKSLNEVRREADDLPPVPGGDVVCNPVYVGLITGQQNIQMQKDQMQAQSAAAGGAGGAPGGGKPGQPQAALGQPGGAQEAFPDLFQAAANPGPEGKPASVKLGPKIAKDAGLPQAGGKKGQEEDESHSVEEMEDPWEETSRSLFGPDLIKATAAFDTLE